MLKVKLNQPDAPEREFHTAIEAAHPIFDGATSCPEGVLVTETHFGRVFLVTHVADTLPRPATTAAEAAQVLAA